MARFVFSLEAVLRHRERIEQDRQRELALAQAEMVRLDGELRSLNQQAQVCTAEVRDHHLLGRLDLAYLAAHRRYMLGMQRKVLAIAERIAVQQLAIDQARRTLLEASRQRKIMEKLKERQHQRWAAAKASRAAAELDEMTTQLSYRSLAAQVEGEK